MNECITKYNESYELESLSPQFDKMKELSDEADFKYKIDPTANKEASLKSMKVVAGMMLSRKIKPVFKRCLRLKSSKQMVLLNLKTLKVQVKTDNDVRNENLKSYVDQMINIVDEVMK